MLGLAILFGLFVWIVITLMSTMIGYKIGKKAHYPNMGALTGFMLIMGGWIVYWIIEFAYIQAKVSYLCKKEAGITVYVTPEQWRKQIGEEEWEKLKPFTDKESDQRYAIYNNKTLSFDNRIYKYTRGNMRAGNIENTRLSYYDFYDKIGIVPIISHILVDENTKKILVKKTYFIYTKKWEDLRIWIASRNCSDTIHKQFHNIALKYSNHN